MGRLTIFTNLAGFNLDNEVFIETGTYKSETLEAASRANYSIIHSIDVVPEYVQEAREKFKDNPKINCHCGTSPDILPQIIDRNKSTTFWLDAHYQSLRDEESCNKYGQCPLLEELKVIFSEPWTKPVVILIDDAHMFASRRENQARHFKLEQWPVRDDIEALLPPDCKMELHADIFIIAPSIST